MYCNSCGKEIPGDSTFCPECGESAHGAAGPATKVISEQSTGEVSPGMNIGIIAGSIIIPLIGIVMGILYMKDSSPAKQKAGKIWLGVGIGFGVFWILVSGGF